MRSRRSQRSRRSLKVSHTQTSVPCGTLNNIFEKIWLTLILLKIFDIYVCHYLVTNNKIAITHLWHAMKLQTMCHLIVKDKVTEEHILGIYSNCNSFGITKALLNSKKFKVAITQLYNVEQV